MKINPLIEIEDLNGTPLKKSVMKVNKEGKMVPVETDENFRLKDALINSLYGQYEDEKFLSGEEKMKRYFLAEKIWKVQGEIDLSAEEITLLKRLVAAAYNILIVGRVYELIDPIEQEKNKQLLQE